MGIVARQGIFSAVNLLIGFSIGAFTNLVIVPFMFSDEISKEKFGLLQLIVAWAVVFSQFLNFGAINIAVRFMPRFRAENRREELHYYTWLFPFIGMFILALFLGIGGYWFMGIIVKEPVMDVGFLVIILFLHTVFMTYFRSLNGIAIADFKNTLGSFFNEVFIRIILILGFALYYLGKIDFVALFWYSVLAYALQFFVMLFTIGGFRLFKIKKPADKKERNELLSFGAYSVLDSGANIFINKIDVIMIGAIIGSADILYYQLAFFMATVISLPGRSLVNVSLAVVNESVHRNDWDNIRKLYRSNSLHQTLVGGIIFILIWINIDTMLALLPEPFRVAKYPFLFLGISKLFDLFTSINGVILSATPYYRYNFYYNLILLSLAVITNFILLPVIGITGAAIATAFCILIYNVLKAEFLYRKFNIAPFHKSNIVMLICLLVPFGIGYYLPEIMHYSNDAAMAEKLKAVFFNVAYRSSIIALVFALLVWFSGVSPEIRFLGAKLARKAGIRKND